MVTKEMVVGLNPVEFVKWGDQLLKLAELVASYTENKVDDKYIAIVRDIISKPWFLPFLEDMLKRFEDGTAPSTEGEFKIVMAQYAGK